MRKNRKTTLHFAKRTISKFTVETVKGGLAAGTQSNQQKTGCNTNCTAWKTTQKA